MFSISNTKKHSEIISGILAGAGAGARDMKEDNIMVELDLRHLEC